MINFFKTSDISNTNNSSVFFINEAFSINALEKILRDALNFKKIQPNKFKSTQNELILDFDIKTIDKKITSSRLRLSKNKNQLHIFAEEVSVNTTSYNETVTPSKYNLKKHVLFKAIQTHILSIQDDNLYAMENKENIHFVQDTNPFIKNYIFHQLKKEEFVLSILNISAVNFDESLDFPKKTLWYFVLTSSRTYIAGQINDNFYTVDISNEHITIEEKTGKDLVKGHSFSFYTEFMNDGYYVALLPVINTTENRLSVFADCLLKEHNKAKHLKVASRCYTLETQKEYTNLNHIKSDLIIYLKALEGNEDASGSIFEVLRKHGLNTAGFGDYLIEIITSWNLDYKQQYAIYKILLQLQSSTAIKNTIGFHDYFSNVFLSTEKNAETIFEFNLTLGKTLAKAEKYTEAITTYETIYNTLPDDSIIDLLPSSKTNLLKGEGGQQLKISILESILNWKEKNKEATGDTLLKLAQLQPLLSHRINALKKHTAYQKKALAIETALSANDYKNKRSLTYKETHYKPLKKTEILEDVVPYCFKNATGFFDSLNNFIATINLPDYASVISFSDKLSSSNYPNIYKDITNICYALKIDTPECYIGRANYANTVVGVEGKPPYLIVGVNFIDPSNPNVLNYNELRFLIAIELAHIYFEHSKITSTDVWRGAAEKGFSIVSVVLTLLPFAGSIGNIIGNFSNIERYTKILNNVEKATNAAEKGQNILEVGEKLNINLLSKKDNEAKNKQELLVTSRLMEIIADKVALLFSNDLNAAVKTIVMSLPSYEQNLPILKKYGLYTFLERVNDEGEFYYQETIIRIRSLFSFYLSDTFEKLKDRLYHNEHV